MESRRGRAFRRTLEESDAAVSGIYNHLVGCIGRHAIFLQKESRNMVPYLVTITGRCGTIGVVARYRCYSPEGGVSCELSKTVDAVRIMTGEQQLVLLD